jgi:CDP-diacylglycerol--glycerol-3-phosphate 3-phosphatidyltransferase
VRDSRGVSLSVFAHWPNRITALRFVGAFVLFGLLTVIGDGDPRQNSGLLQFSFWLFVVVASTDFLDGYLARRDNHTSTFGRIADPFVDKVLILGVLVYLAVLPWSRPWVPAWAVVLILAREFLVTGIRGWVESTGREFGADRLGKVKMVLQSIAVGGILFLHAFPWPDEFFPYLSWMAHALILGTIAITVISGASYVLKTRTLVEEIKS